MLKYVQAGWNHALIMIYTIVCIATYVREFCKKMENVKGNNEVNVCKMNADRVEECYFLWKAINLFRKMDQCTCLTSNRLMWRK